MCVPVPSSPPRHRTRPGSAASACLFALGASLVLLSSRNGAMDGKAAWGGGQRQLAMREKTGGGDGGGGKDGWKTNPLPSSEADDNVMCPLDGGRFNICLDLNGFDRKSIKRTEAYFQKAKEKWESVIVDDLERVPALGLDPAYLCSTYPSHVDDLYVCGKGSEIDGVGGVLGHAFVAYKRSGGSELPLVGNMRFDIADLDRLGPQLESVILHEMGHLLGISKVFWELKGAVKEGIYVGENAIREWRAMGCPGSPPVETDGGTGTSNNHWDEEEMDHELMTGVLDACEGTCPLSRVTVGTLADLGYGVNYTNADPYKPDCVGGAASEAEEGGGGESAARRRRRLERKTEERQPGVRVLRSGGGMPAVISRDGATRARSYGKMMLRGAGGEGGGGMLRTFRSGRNGRRPAPALREASDVPDPADGPGPADRVEFVANEYIDVIVEEYGNIYALDVFAEEEDRAEEGRFRTSYEGGGRVRQADKKTVTYR